MDEKLAEFGINEGDSVPASSATVLPIVPGPSSKNDHQESEYLRARKSLHVWPVPSASFQALRKFALDYLKMEETAIDRIQVISVTPVRLLPQ